MFFYFTIVIDSLITISWIFFISNVLNDFLPLMKLLVSWMPTDGITSNDSRLYKEEEELKIELFFILF